MERRRKNQGKSFLLRASQRKPKSKEKKSKLKSKIKLGRELMAEVAADLLHLRRRRRSAPGSVHRSRKGRPDVLHQDKHQILHEGTR